MKQAWRALWRWRWPILGVIVGAVLADVLRASGVGITVEEGILWGAVAGLVVMYTPYFLRSGKMVTKRENRGVNFVVGVFVFLGISAIIIAVFLGIFWVLSLFIR